MEERALLIEWNPSTGNRAGDINPRDKNLHCNGWQNMDVSPAVELRLVTDDRDLSAYENTDGVNVLIGKDAINKEIVKNFPSKFVIEDELIYSEHIKSNRGKMDIASLPNNREDRLKELKNKHGIHGIRESKPQLV